MSPATRLYSLLLRAYPRRLRKQFGDDMLELFADQLADARNDRRTARFYARTLLDWLHTVPAEHYLEHRRNAPHAPAPPIGRVITRGLVFAPNVGIGILMTAGILAWRCIGTLHKKWQH